MLIGFLGTPAMIGHMAGASLAFVDCFTCTGQRTGVSQDYLRPGYSAHTSPVWAEPTEVTDRALHELLPGQTAWHRGRGSAYRILHLNHLAEPLVSFLQVIIGLGIKHGLPAQRVPMDEESAFP